MHELSIAHSLIELATQAAAQAGVTRVTAVHLRLGVLAGVVKDALLFGFEIASAGTILEGARLEIEDLPLRIHCAACDTVVTLPDIQHFRCPYCGTPGNRIMSGRELELSALEYDDTVADSAGESYVNSATP
ncbi:MAG: hydrogenase maturation nickel metallochaperone HypA [Chloroflexi bacterium]|nr:hydrogenase maturation nickel metallochaperone HypA [Chloroflexota bacterium]